MPYDVAVFGAHPDDAEMGMGGTIAKLAGAGHATVLVSLTRGESGTYGTPDDRAREAANAAQILGCDHRLLDFPDTQVQADVASRLRIMQLLRELRPRIVFAPYYANTLGHHDGAAHVDHLATGNIVREAVKLARLRGVQPEHPILEVQRLYYYMVPRNLQPMLLVDVTEHFDTLVRAIEAYETQLAIRRQGKQILDILKTFRAYSGYAAGCGYAEAFLCDEPLRADIRTLFAV